MRVRFRTLPTFTVRSKNGTFHRTNFLLLFKVYSDTFQKSEQIFEENKIDQDKCGAEAWGYASAGKFYIEPIPEDSPL